MHRITPTLFLVSTFLLAHFAHAATLRGLVTNQSGTPLSDVAIIVKELNTITYTNKNGVFQLDDVASSSITIHIKLLGYVEKTQRIELGPDGNTIAIILDEWVESLPEIVVSGTSIIGGQRALKNIPGSSTYISPRELARFTNSDPMRVLRNVPGIIIQEEDGFGLRPNIGMRGTGTDRSSKITVMEDGILAAPAPYAAPAAYYFPNTARMQGVEIIKGSSTIKYGPFTTGGVLNFVSSPISTQGTTVNMRVSTGTFNTRELYAQASVGNQKAGISVEGLNQSSDGFKELDGGQPTNFNKNDFIIKARYVLPDIGQNYQHNIAVKAGYNQEISHESYTGLNAEDFSANAYRRYIASENDVFNANQMQLNASYNATYRAFSFSATAYKNTFTRNWYKLDKVTDDFGVTHNIASVLENPDSLSNAMQILAGASSLNSNALQVKANNRSYTSQGIQFLANWQLTEGETKHLVEAGVRLHKDEMDLFQWVDFYGMADWGTFISQRGTPGTANNSIDKASAFASFVQYTFTYGKWSIVPGIRYESINFSKTDYGKNDLGREGSSLKTTTNEVDSWIPGIGATYTLNALNTLFAGIHKGFAPPGTKEGTMPESSVNYEVGWRATYARFSTTITGFANDYSNLLGSDLNAGGGAGTNELFNAGAALVAGLEFGAQADLLPKSATWSLPFALTYTYTFGRFNNTFTSSYEPWGNVQSGDLMPYLPQHQLSALLSLEKGRFAMSINPKYTSIMRAEAGTGIVPSTQSIPATLITDFSTSYRLFNQMVIFVAVRNLTNETYLAAMRPAGLLPGMPRMVIGGLKVML
jgi:Fe(3+) dicitrate transport protein